MNIFEDNTNYLVTPTFDSPKSPMTELQNT